MKNVLCYGDSNTYGYMPGGFGRYGFAARWTGQLQKLLGPDWQVIEEGLCGRTTVFDEPGKCCRAGSDYLRPCLASHRPIDVIVIMLGTNDCKTVFGASAGKIAAGLERLIRIAREETLPGTKILIVSPILLGAGVTGPDGDPDFDERSVEASIGLAAEFEKVAKRNGCLFLNAAKYAEPGPDYEHMTEKGHEALARAAADIILKSE